MKTLISFLTVAFCMVLTSNSYASYVKLKGQFENTNNNTVEIKVAVYDHDLEDWIQLDYYKAGKNYSVKFVTSFDYRVTFIMVDKVTGEKTEKNLYHAAGEGEGKFATNQLDVDFRWKSDCIMQQTEQYAYEFVQTDKDPLLTARI
jgi:hypothetical protein